MERITQKKRLVILICIMVGVLLAVVAIKLGFFKDKQPTVKNIKQSSNSSSKENAYIEKLFKEEDAMLSKIKKQGRGLSAIDVSFRNTHPTIFIHDYIGFIYASMQYDNYKILDKKILSPTTVEYTVYVLYNDRRNSVTRKIVFELKKNKTWKPISDVEVQ